MGTKCYVIMHLLSRVNVEIQEGNDDNFVETSYLMLPLSSNFVVFLL